MAKTNHIARLLAFATLAGLPFVASIARSEPSMVDRAAAQTLFDDAVQLVAAQRYKEACPKLEESQRIDPGIGTQFNLADCYEKIGRTASAWVNFSEVADAALKESNPERERVAKDRANAVSKRLSYLTVTVTHPVNGLVVTRDGVDIRAGTWGTAFPLDQENASSKRQLPIGSLGRRRLSSAKTGRKRRPLCPSYPISPSSPGRSHWRLPFPSLLHRAPLRTQVVRRIRRLGL